MAITVRELEAAKPKDAPYKLTAERGLYLRVATDGRKTWLVRYVVGGIQRQVRLPLAYGQGPGYMSLAEARSENARIQGVARTGIDFQEQASAARIAATLENERLETESLPVRALFEAWLADGVQRSDGNAELRRSFEKDVLPPIGEKPVRSVTDKHLLELLREVGRVRGRGRTAGMLLSSLRQMFRWAERRQPWRGLLAEGNPAELVEEKFVVAPDYTDAPRDRVLLHAEIRQLHDIFKQTEADYCNAQNRRTATRPLRREAQLALWICLSTGCRIGELLVAKWENVNLDTAAWHVPAADTKTAVAWDVYLSDFALRQFRELRALSRDSAWCFPSRNASDTHVCVKSVTKQVGDRQSRFKDRKALKHRRNDDTLVLHQGTRGEWTPHDLRRTAATMMQQLGIHPDVIDRCQNHVLPGSKIRRHYLHHDYAEEKRSAWEQLANKLESILGIDESGSTSGQALAAA